MNQQAEDIKAIREMMEKSSKFLSLSGLSGIFAGVTATLSAILLRYGILLWVIGFGFCHIIYGWIMYNKYDQKK